jgi:NADH-quinone oxidoreductase subunit N
MFQITDIPRILPEILLLFLALIVLSSDIFEKWGRTAAAQLERARSSASLTAIGLGLIFIITFLQSGYIPGTVVAPEASTTNPLLSYLMGIVRNLQAGGPGGAPIVGAFATDDLTMIARLLLIGAAFLTSLLCLDDLPTAHPAEFYAMILFATTGMCLMVGAQELIMAYLAIELTSIPLYLLTGYVRSDSRSAEAGTKYFLFGALSSAILLYGMSLTYGFVASGLGGIAVSGNLTQFERIAELARSGGASTPLLTLAMLLILAGLGYKLAIVPFHGWAPDVYQAAPTPITAFISTASKAAGFLLLLRLLSVAFPASVGSATLGATNLGGWTALLALLALLTLLVGNLAALPQSNTKRLLAWSSVAHAGFLLLGLVAWAAPERFDREQGSVALIYYLIVYTLTNLGAFGALVALSRAGSGVEITDLNGLARRNLPLATMLTICVLSLAGIPPLGGFFAKFYIFMVGWQSGAYWLVIVALVMTVVSLYYYLRLLRAMFIEAPSSGEPLRIEPATMTTLIITTAGLILLGLFPNLVLGLIGRVQTIAGL